MNPQYFQTTLLHKNFMDSNAFHRMDFKSASLIAIIIFFMFFINHQKCRFDTRQLMSFSSLSNIFDLNIPKTSSLTKISLLSKDHL